MAFFFGSRIVADLGIARIKTHVLRAYGIPAHPPHVRWSVSLVFMIQTRDGAD